MGAWSADSKTHVAHMTRRRFLRQRKIRHRRRSRQRSASNSSADDGTVTVLKEKTALKAGEIIDAAVMSKPRAARVLRGADRRTRRSKGVLLSLHLKATMMKISDPDHVRPCRRGLLQGRVRQARARLQGTGRQSQQRPRRPVRENRQAAGSPARRDRGRHRRPCYKARPRTGDGELRQGHHQPARAQRRDRRCLHARHDPRRRQDVGRGRQAARHQGDDPRPLLRGHLSGRDRGLQEARRVRSAAPWAACPTSA